MQAQAAQMRQFEEVLIHELKMQEEERVILRHTADTVKQVRILVHGSLFTALCSPELALLHTMALFCEHSFVTIFYQDRSISDASIDTLQSPSIRWNIF